MSFNNVVPGNNWETPYSDYTPFILNITDISNAQRAVVTTVEDSPYSAGEIISFRVSAPYGMTEINNLSGRVLSVSDNIFTVEIDTLGFNQFVYPPVGTVVIPAVTVPVGSGRVPNSAVPMTNLQDCFDNAP
jgi:hypothetical protein